MNPHRFFMGRAIGLLVLVVIVGGFFLFNNYFGTEAQQPQVVTDHKNATYLIEGQSVTLRDGVAETDGVVTRHFGNELTMDLDGDGAEDDIAFILTQERGGSGTFFYAVAARNTEEGFVGSDGYLLGDRIAPQTTNVSPNPRHKHVVVFNYADRAVGEPMTTQPSVGKSAYLKLDLDSMRWGIVEPDFEGESR